jgi:hypothetical protein
VVSNSPSVAKEYYAANTWMKNGQVNGQREAGSYTEAYNWMSNNTRKAFRESEALILAAMFTSAKQA